MPLWSALVAEQPQVLATGERRELALTQKHAMLLLPHRVDGLRHLPHDVEPIEDDLGVYVTIRSIVEKLREKA